LSRICFISLSLAILAGTAARAGELTLSQEESEVIAQTNAERKAAGLPELSISPQLMEAARKHSSNMAANSRLDHTLGGRSVSDRVRSEGYSFRSCGENIAWNQSSPLAVLRSWMSSSGHRANITSRNFTEIGVAVSVNARGERYWTQVFAAR
jgi:uncharacterized protein YkwD